MKNDENLVTDQDVNVEELSVVCGQGRAGSPCKEPAPEKFPV